MKPSQLLYSEIRTPNMAPDRSADLTFHEPTLTQQQFLEECDINKIVQKNYDTGILTHTPRGTPQWGDYGGAPDFHAAQNYLAETSALFMQLPALVRERFQNSPANFLDFVNNDENEAELVRMGLANVRPDPEPTPAPKPSKKPSEVPQE